MKKCLINMPLIPKVQSNFDSVFQSCFLNSDIGLSDVQLYKSSNVNLVISKTKCELKIPLNEPRLSMCLPARYSSVRGTHSYVFVSNCNKCTLK